LAQRPVFKVVSTLVSQNRTETVTAVSGLKKISKVRQEPAQDGVQVQNGVT
jgi:hypothetical protein